MQVISDILAKHDIMGLIRLGAPANEYENEAIEIVRTISSTMKRWCETHETKMIDKNYLSLICKSTFVDSFLSLEYNYAKFLLDCNYLPLAEEIYDAIWQEDEK